MDNSSTIEGFAAELAQASNPEQSAPDSGDAIEALISGQEATTDDAPEAGQPETEGERQEQPEQPPEGSGEGDDDPVHAWTTASGEKFEAKLSELRDGYLRQQDYTRKTQDLAENVKRAQSDIQFQANAVQALAGEIGEIQAIQAQIAAFDGVDWRAAEQSDPQTALQAQTKLLMLKQKLADAQNRAGGRMQQLKQAQEAQFSQAVSAAEQHLAKAIPDVTPDEMGKVFTRLAKMGASPTELNYMRGMPWLVEAAVYAHRWQELQSKKPEVQNKVRNLPPPKTAPRAAVPHSKEDEVVKAINSRKTFSADQFARLLKSTSR